MTEILAMLEEGLTQRRLFQAIVELSCMQPMANAESGMPVDAKGTLWCAGQEEGAALVKHHLFLDESATLFSRRLAWSPDGEAPRPILHMHNAVVIDRKCIGRAALMHI